MRKKLKRKVQEEEHLDETFINICAAQPQPEIVLIEGRENSVPGPPQNMAKRQPCPFRAVTTPWPEPMKFNAFVPAKTLKRYEYATFPPKKPFEITSKLLRSNFRSACSLDGRLCQRSDSSITQLFYSAHIILIYLPQLFLAHRQVAHNRDTMWLQAMFNVREPLRDLAEQTEFVAGKNVDSQVYNTLADAFIMECSAALKAVASQILHKILM